MLSCGAESKHLYRSVAGVRDYYAKEMLRLRCAPLSMTGEIDFGYARKCRPRRLTNP